MDLTKTLRPLKLIDLWNLYLFTEGEAAESSSEDEHEIELENGSVDDGIRNTDVENQNEDEMHKTKKDETKKTTGKKTVAQMVKDKKKQTALTLHW